MTLPSSQRPDADRALVGELVAAQRPPDARIEWAHLIARRPRVLEHEPELRPYLLLPEVQALIYATANDHHRFMTELLWWTGARVSELLALTPHHFVLGTPYDSTVSIGTLKQRPRGRRPASARATLRRRLVPLADEAIIKRIGDWFATHEPAPREPLITVTRMTVNNRLQRWAPLVAGLPFLPSAKTFRHSFAINAVLHGVPTRVLQQWLGHEHLSSTEIYTAVLGSETAHFMRRVPYALGDHDAGVWRPLLDSPPAAAALIEDDTP